MAHLRPKPGADPQTIINSLQERISALDNLLGQAGGVGPNPTSKLAEAYTLWVHQTQNQLSAFTHDLSLLDHLLSDRYWHIHQLESLKQPLYIVEAETKVQKAWLADLKANMERRVHRANGSPGHTVVLDTNVLLHFKPLEELPWQTIVDADAVRLVVPLRVIEELDEKKYARRDNLSKRARTILPHIESLIGPSGEPGRVVENVSVEVFTEPGARDRPLDADEEILHLAVELRDLSNHPVTVLTGDVAMRLRARGLDLTAIRLEDEHRRGLNDTDP